jgi:transcription elongation factor Elf1
MERKPVTCPECGKTLIFHLDGEESKYELKCHNNRCGATIEIFSAGRTAVVAPRKGA